MNIDIELKRAVENLGACVFGLNVLRNFGKFNEKQKKKIDIAYKMTSGVYDEFRGFKW